MYRLNKIIPDGWGSVQFNESFKLLSTLTLSRDDLSFNGDGIGIFNIHYGDIHSTYKYSILDCEKESIPVIIKDGIDINKLTFLEEGDVVIADASEDYEGVGSAIEILNIGDKKLTGGLHTFVARSSNGKISKGFGSYVFNHPWVANELKKIATGSKVYGISKANISTIELILPPLPEQQKIAVVLGKWDELIEQQTQLIAVKEKRKKGLAEGLLMGRTRLKGFSDKWDEYKLVDVVNYFGGAAFKSLDQVDSGMKWLKIANVGIGTVKWNEVTYLPEDFKDSYSRYLLTDGDIVMALTRPILNGELKIARMEPVDGDALLNQRVAKLTPKGNQNVDFIYHLHQLPRLIYKMESLIAGTDPPNVGVKDLESIIVKIPLIEEQNAIVNLLNAVDEEIKVLRLELKVIEKQKKGIMQQLLTGKIRVKV